MKNRKILSAVITAAILVGSVAPSYTAFAESWTEDQTAAQAPALQAAVSVSTFEALKEAVQTANAEIEVTATITVTEDIDLNGATLKAVGTEENFGQRMIYITGSNVTISNGTIDADGIDTYVVDLSDNNNATTNSATLRNLTVSNERLTNAGYTNVTAHSIIRNYGTLTLNNCTVKAGDPAAVKVEEGATLNVNGGSITGNAIGITTYGTTNLSGGTTVSTATKTNALYVLTYGSYESKTTVDNATVTGTIVYGANGAAASKAPEVEIKAGATLIDSGYTLTTNPSLRRPSVDPTLSIDPDASVQLASTTGLDPILVAALDGVENITDGEGNEFAVASDGSLVNKADLPTGSKVPTGYVGLTLTEKGTNVYGVTMSLDELRALKFSPANSGIGRTKDGYYPGFYVEAFDKTKNGNKDVIYDYRLGWVEIGDSDITAAQVKELDYAIPDYTGITASGDGQFWPRLTRDWLNIKPDGRDHFIYALKTNYGGGVDYYYYIDVNLHEIPEDFAFGDEENCTGTHTDDPCAICGNVKKYEITDTTAANANGSITIKDADENDVEKAKKGAEITITITPDTGYTLDALKINGTAAEVTGDTYTHTMDGVDTEIEATFKAIAVTGVTLDKSTLALVAGDSDTLTATVLPANAKDKTVAWSSNKPEIAKVDATGKVTAVAAGEATITVTTTDGAKTATCTVTVTAATVAVESVTLNKTALELTVSGSETLTAEVLPATATNKTVTWTSSDTSVATVVNGKIIGVKAGTATITATCGGKSATCAVTVTEAAKPDETVTLKAGEQKVLTTKVNADKTRTETAVLVVPASTASSYAGVKVTVKAGDWTKTSALIKTCYAKVVHTDADGVKTTVDAGSDFVIAVEVTDIPESVTTVDYSFAPANE